MTVTPDQMHREAVPMPERIAKLARDKHGRPVPWFVAYVKDGKPDPEGEPDFRIMDGHRLVDAHNFELCWTCGQRRGRIVTFVIGPMCAINRVSAEPPSHKDCAMYSALACPFLSRPTMVRRERGIEDYHVSGVMLPRNPGVTLVWTTRNFKRFSDRRGGHLFELGDPVETSWWREGRPATRAEILESIDSGLPELRKMDKGNLQAMREIDARYEQTLQYLPA